MTSANQKRSRKTEDAQSRRLQRLVSSLRRPAKTKLRLWSKRIEADQPAQPKPSHKYAVLLGYLQALADIEAANAEVSASGDENQKPK